MMPTAFRSPLLLVFLPLVLLLAAIPASAQTRVRVKLDQTVIWRPGFTLVATSVNAGTVLEVAGRQGTWYIVYLTTPPNRREVGLIADTSVETVGGAPAAPAPRLPQRPAGGGTPQRPAPGGQRPAGTAPRVTPVPSFRGFAQAGYGWQTAHESFRALFGSPGGVWFGGGGDYSFRNRTFIEGSIDFSRRTGTRVFVANGEVFELDIDETVTMVPVRGTVGYRFARSGPVPYVGGGGGALIYRETSEFADADENVSRTMLTYHALAGIEWRTSSRVSTAVEVQYSRVPDDLAGGVGDAFDEHDLGGVVVRGKVLFGGR